MTSLNNPRNGCHDIWNAFMVKGCTYSNNDIPISFATGKIPNKLVGWDEAKAIHKENISKGNVNYYENSFIHWYMDDQKFDGKKSSIWLFPEKTFEIICHFAGVISPDFSTNTDFPEAIKKYNFYRMRAYDYWLSTKGIPTIYNVRWGTKETWNYCWDGIPPSSIVSIGTIASGLKKKENRIIFEEGLNEMIRVIKPSAIIVYGSSNYKCFETLQNTGIPIFSFPSKTSIAFKKGVNNNEQT